MRNLLILLLLFPVLCFSQTSKWDSESKIYCDYQNGFSWQLPIEFEWRKELGTEKHTVFKVFDETTGITAFVNIVPIVLDTAKETDIFVLYDRYVKAEAELRKQQEYVTGEKTVESSMKKVSFAGKNSIKRFYTTEINDDRYEKPFRIVATTYTFIYDKSTWSISIKCYKEVYDYFKEGGFPVEEIFKGFTFINKY